MVNFSYTILYVENVVKTIEFYEKCFGFKRNFISPDNDYGELSTGSTTLSFANHTLARSNFTNNYQKSNTQSLPFGIEIGITTTNVKELLERVLENDGTLFEKPKVKPWGQTVAYARDINGFLLEICTPVNNV